MWAPLGLSCVSAVPRACCIGGGPGGEAVAVGGPDSLVLVGPAGAWRADRVFAVERVCVAARGVVAEAGEGRVRLWEPAADGALRLCADTEGLPPPVADIRAGSGGLLVVADTGALFLPHEGPALQLAAPPGVRLCGAVPCAPMGRQVLAAWGRDEKRGVFETAVWDLGGGRVVGLEMEPGLDPRLAAAVVSVRVESSGSEELQGSQCVRCSCFLGPSDICCPACYHRPRSSRRAASAASAASQDMTQASQEATVNMPASGCKAQVTLPGSSRPELFFLGKMRAADGLYVIWSHEGPFRMVDAEALAREGRLTLEGCSGSQSLSRLQAWVTAPVGAPRRAVLRWQAGGRVLLSSSSTSIQSESAAEAWVSLRTEPHDASWAVPADLVRVEAAVAPAVSGVRYVSASSAGSPGMLAAACDRGAVYVFASAEATSPSLLIPPFPSSGSPLPPLLAVCAGAVVVADPESGHVHCYSSSPPPRGGVDRIRRGREE